MMKKISLYILVGIGIFAILLFSYYLLANRVAGSTMFGSGRPDALYAVEASPSAIGGVAMKSSPGSRPPLAEPAMRRMIIRNANVTLQVNDLNHAMDEITQLADSSGGYVVRSNISQDGTNPNSNGWADISIRVPAEGLNSALKQLKLIANQVIQESINGEDITQQFVDLESQLGNLQKSKIQLEKIMLQAVKTDDVLKVNQQLTETQGQIDVLTGQIKYYKESVAYSLIDITLKMSPGVAIEQPLQWNPGLVFKNSYRHLISGLRAFTYNIIQFAVFWLPLILLWGCCFLVALWVVRKLYHLLTH